MDDLEYFDGDPSFRVVPHSERDPIVRHVLFVGWEVDKRSLAFPFFGALIIAAIVAVSVGISTEDIATGAQVGGSLCGVITVIFCYVVWRCN